jgi:hypothetical protein
VKAFSEFATRQTCLFAKPGYSLSEIKQLTRNRIFRIVRHVPRVKLF